MRDLKWLADYRAGLKSENSPPRRVGQYDSTARAEIAEEFERRKREEGTAFQTGEALRREGHTFFEADRDYFLKPIPEKGLTEVSAFNCYDEALLDFDGRTNNECCYDWWYLDERLNPIPGFTRPIKDSLSNHAIFKHKFEVIQDGASRALREAPPQAGRGYDSACG